MDVESKASQRANGTPKAENDPKQANRSTSCTVGGICDHDCSEEGSTDTKQGARRNDKGPVFGPVKTQKRAGVHCIGPASEGQRRAGTEVTNGKRCPQEGEQQEL